MTAEVKDELSRLAVNSVSARRAEVASLLRFAGGLHIVSGRVVVEAEVDLGIIARRLRKDIYDLYGYNAVVHVLSASGIRRNTRYVVRVARDGEALARQTGLLDLRGRPVRGLPAQVVGGSVADAEAAWRGAFLAHGSLTEPGRSSALEVSCPGPEAALALVGAARRLGVSAKAREVRGSDRVVVRDGEAIGALLTRMGAQDTRLTWEERRMRREVRATANRLANFDDANLRRSARAAVAAAARVERALQILGDTVPDHLPGIDDLVEPLLVDETGFERSLLQCQAIIICLMRDRRGLVVADHRAERGHQHQRASDRLLDPRAVQSRSLHGEAAEFVARVAEHPGRVEEVVDHDRAHRVELEIALAAGESHGVVFTDHLDADHHHCFALGRIDLARHDRGAGLVLRQQELAEAAARAGGKPAHVVGDFHQRDCETAQGRHRRDDRVQRALRREFVRRGDERMAGQFRDFRRDFLTEVRRRIQPSADCGTAGGHLEQTRFRRANARQRIADLVGPARPFLSYSQRHGILQMRSAGLDHIHPFIGFGLDGGS